MHVQVKHGDHEDGQMHLFQRKVSQSCGAAASAPSVVAALRHRNQKAPPRQTRAERHAAKPRRRSGQVASGIGQVASGIGQVASGIGQVASGIGQVASGIFTKANFTELMRETFVRKGRWVRPRGSATHTLQRNAHVANAQRTRCKRATHTLQRNAHVAAQRTRCNAQRTRCKRATHTLQRNAHVANAQRALVQRTRCNRNGCTARLSLSRAQVSVCGMNGPCGCAARSSRFSTKQKRFVPKPLSPEP